MRKLTEREKTFIKKMKMANTTIFYWEYNVFGGNGTLYNNGNICKFTIMNKQGTIIYLGKKMLDVMVKKGAFRLVKKEDSLCTKRYLYYLIV